MVQMENITLKNILENLDDARKYQSLRDILRDIPAVDLAAVFEELPKEKMPILFRLCQEDQAAGSSRSCPPRLRKSSLTASATRS